MAKQDRSNPGREPITDPSEFEHVMELIRDDNKHYQHSAMALKSLLRLLIENAITDLVRSNSLLNGIGEGEYLDSAKGAYKLLNEYRSLMTENEEAAAEWLFTLHMALEEVSDNEPLEQSRIEEIEQRGLTLISWRLHTKHMALEKRNEHARNAPRKGHACRNQSIAEAARKLLKDGCAPRELVGRMIERGSAEDLSDDALRAVLQAEGVLPRPKPRGSKKPKTE